VASARLTRNLTAGVIASGVALLVATIGYLGTSPVLASGLALIIALVLALGWSIQRWRGWRAVKAAG
jgi:hypothetical protein